MNRVKGPSFSQAEVKNAKVRITTYLDQDVLTTLRDVADQSGHKYQSVLNQILKDYFFGKKTGLISRIEKLEQSVFKKKILA